MRSLAEGMCCFVFLLLKSSANQSPRARERERGGVGRRTEREGKGERGGGKKRGREDERGREGERGERGKHIQLFGVLRTVNRQRSY